MNEVVLQCPAGPAAVHAVAITRGYLGHLEEMYCLNDDLVDFYLKVTTTDDARSLLLRDLGQGSEALKKKVHVFSSHFHTKFIGEEIKRKDTQSHVAAYTRVKRWTRGVNVFSRDFNIVPFVRDLHWVLAVICYPDRLAESLQRKSNRDDSINVDGDDETQPCILLLDSLKTRKSKAVYDHLAI